MNELKTANITEQVPVVRKKIGKTTYIVKLHFSKTSKQTLNDKIMRLVKSDIEKMQK
ncbi:MAG: hypothetical protein HFE51_10080 [Clostridia bacterium]|nr:hypothetical protein [Clostridia bacterium]